VLKLDFTSGGGAGKQVLAHVRFQIGGWLRARLGFYSARSLFFVFHIFGRATLFTKSLLCFFRTFFFGCCLILMHQLQILLTTQKQS
jgi:hypothetical protein